MKVKITKNTFNGVEFYAEPGVLNLGGVGSRGVQRLEFELPEEWKNLTVTMHVEREGGDRPEPIVMDSDRQVVVDKRFTAVRRGIWMLLATNGSTYTAMTRPAPYRCYKTIDSTPAGEDVQPSLYEKLIEQVAASQSAAASSAAQAAKAREGAETALKNTEAAAARAEAASLSMEGDASNLKIYPYTRRYGGAALTAGGLTLTRADTRVTLSGQGSTYAVWKLDPAEYPKNVLRITGKCTALTGGMKLVLSGMSKEYPDENNYYDLAVLAAGKEFDVTVDLEWWKAHADEQDLDMSKPLDLRFLFTGMNNTATLEGPVLSAKTLDTEWVGDSGMTLSELLEKIETIIRRYHP